MDESTQTLTQLEIERLATLHKIGILHDQILSRPVPIRMTASGPELLAWPGRAIGALRAIYRQDTIVIVTDGISDNWDRELHPSAPQWTFGFELMVEVPVEGPPTEMSAEEICDTWLPPLLWATTDWLVAERVDLKGLVCKFDCATVAIPPVAGLEEYVCKNGYMAGLVGMPFAGEVGGQVVMAQAGPEPTWLMTLKLLTPDEYEYAMQDTNGAAAKRLIAGFIARGDAHMTWNERDSVVPELTT